MFLIFCSSLLFCVFVFNCGKEPKASAIPPCTRPFLSAFVQFSLLFTEEWRRFFSLEAKKLRVYTAFNCVAATTKNRKKTKRISNGSRDKASALAQLFLAFFFLLSSSLFFPFFFCLASHFFFSLDFRVTVVSEFENGCVLIWCCACGCMCMCVLRLSKQKKRKKKRKRE